MPSLYKKFFLVLIPILALSLNPKTSLASNLEAEKFVKDLSLDAIKLLKSNLDDKQKQDKLTKLFTNSVDMDWMGKFVTGKYWRSMTSEQKQKYAASYKKFLIASYIPKFKEYTNQEIKINRVTADEDNVFLAQTDIVAADSTKIAVDYKLKKASNGKFLIIDIIAEGISLITTQRDDFGSVLAREGVDELIAKLGKTN